MNHPSRTASVLTILATAFTISGCATPEQQPRPTAPSTTAAAPTATPSPLPPRPTTIPLDGIDPCNLLTPTEAKRYNTNPGIPDASDDGAGCEWSNDSAKPNNAWAATLVVAHGADYFLGSVAGASQINVDGFTAVQTNSNMAIDPEAQCLLYIDVAPGQSLEVSYQNLNGDYPGINHQVACGLAAKAAHLMLTNLRTLTH